MKIFTKKNITILLSTFLLFVGICSGVLLIVHNSVKGLIYNYDDIKDVPSKSVAIVFGASVNSTTRLPSDILRDRLVTAIDLYNKGKVKKIILSGDNRVTHYNEPKVMQRYAELLSVPEEDIVLDYAGRRTYDTCYRAKEIFQIDEAILVTQEYHLYRALYTCNALGLDSIGVSASRQKYKGQFYYDLREIPATLLAIWQVYVSHPEPILGEKEKVFDEN
ncbi:YdcF family protein [bacterium]|nr:YdcF family protein [bacterium]